MRGDGSAIGAALSSLGPPPRGESPPARASSLPEDPGNGVVMQPTVVPSGPHYSEWDGRELEQPGAFACFLVPKLRLGTQFTKLCFVLGRDLAKDREAELRG